MSDDTADQPLYADQRRYLKDMAEKYALPDEHKAPRVLVNYAMEEGNLASPRFGEPSHDYSC